MTLLVHAVIRTEDRPFVADEHPSARVVAEPDVAAVVSDVREQVDESDAPAHVELLSSLATSIPALPLTFATTASDEEAVRSEVLRPGAATFRQQLEALTDVVEVRIRVRFDEEASLSAIAQADGEELRRLKQATLAAGAGVAARMSLGEEIARRMRARQAASFWALVGPASDVAERVTVLERDAQFSVALLLRRDRLPDMDGAVATMRGSGGEATDIEYVGPLPPLTFLPELLDESEPSRDRQSRWGW